MEYSSRTSRSSLPAGKPLSHQHPFSHPLTTLQPRWGAPRGRDQYVPSVIETSLLLICLSYGYLCRPSRTDSLSGGTGIRRCQVDPGYRTVGLFVIRCNNKLMVAPFKDVGVPGQLIAPIDISVKPNNTYRKLLEYPSSPTRRRATSPLSSLPVADSRYINC